MSLFVNSLNPRKYSTMARKHDTYHCMNYARLHQTRQCFGFPNLVAYSSLLKIQIRFVKVSSSLAQLCLYNACITWIEHNKVKAISVPVAGGAAAQAEDSTPLLRLQSLRVRHRLLLHIPWAWCAMLPRDYYLRSRALLSWDYWHSAPSLPCTQIKNVEAFFFSSWMNTPHISPY